MAYNKALSLSLQEDDQSTSNPKRRNLGKQEKSTPKRSRDEPRGKSTLPKADPSSGNKLKTVNSRDPRLNNGTTKPPDAELKLAADVVVRYLMPYYKEGRFASKVRVTEKYRLICVTSCIASFMLKNRVNKA